jgi:lipoate-protein ligase A
MSFNLIVSGSGGCSGSFNMSADLFLLGKYKIADDFSSRPTLRIYYFSPPALSLGFFQKDRDIDERIIEKAKKKGYDIVSRPTGGRAVLHKSEITYSVTASYKNGIFAGKLIETYKKIGDFLYLFFVKLGLKPDTGAGGLKGAPPQGKNNKNNKGAKNNFNCFLKAHSYEITFEGRKICGNSQRRSDSAFLQHGSIYIDYNPEEHIELFNGGSAGDDDNNWEYFNNITGIRQEMEKAGADYSLSDLSFGRLSKIMAESFSEAYGVKPVPMPEDIIKAT